MSKNLVDDIMDSTKEKLKQEADKVRLVKQAEAADVAEAERKMNERMKNFLVQETLGFELVMNDELCYSDELAYNPKKYMLKACADMQEPGKVPDLEKFKDCKTDFCLFCCANYIGEAHEDKRVVCKNKCVEKMKGKGISVKVPIQNQVEKLSHNTIIAKDILKSYTE